MNTQTPENKHGDLPESAILCVVGARPNFMKIAPILRAMQAAMVPVILVHTGQHYDESMNDAFFRDLGIPQPDINLGVGSGSHTVQTAEIMLQFEPVLKDLCPKAVLVVGDVNSTIACSLVAAKQGVPIVHVEAGLRSYDRAMPEEINRILTDQLSDLLFVTEESGISNLAKEGIAREKVHFVGNVMIDSLFYSKQKAIPATEVLLKHGCNAEFGKQDYVLLTMHRPSNVDDEQTLRGIIAAIEKEGLCMVNKT